MKTREKKPLSKDPKKINLYKMEIPYRISTCLAQMYWPDQYENKVYKYAIAIIKPETVMLGKVSEVISIIDKAGFEIIFYSKRKLTAQQTYEMWKFGWENASTERILINQKLFSICDSIILILHCRFSAQMSACEILTDLKGDSCPEKRKPYQIRSQLHPLNYILNFIHTSDESADFLREIGILFDWDEITNIFNIMNFNTSITLPYTEQIAAYKSQLSLQLWLKDIYYRIVKTDMDKHCKTYVENILQQFEYHPNRKIPLNFLRILSQYNLINWNFETLVILSNYIEYMRKDY